MPVSEISQLFLDIVGAEKTFKVFLVKHHQSFGKFFTDADIIDHEPETLSGKSAIGPCDCLKKSVLSQSLIQIHYLLYRSIKPGQELIADNQEFQRIL